MKKLFLMAALAISSVMVYSAEYHFIKVTDAGTLKDGDKVVMGCAAKNEVSAGFSSTNKFLDGVAATFADGEVTVDNPKIITLKKNGDYWNLYFGDKVIGHKSSSSDLDGSKCRYTTNFAITIAANGTANIVSQTPGADDAEVFFNHHNTSSRFALYKATSNQRPIELYKLDEGSIPDIEPTSVTLNPTELKMRVGDAAQTLTATILPSDAKDKTVTWGSTDASIASVADGKVSAVAPGTAKIWVKTNTAEKTDTCFVTVLPAMDTEEATFKAVQKAEYLPAGAKVFFGTIKSGENYVMGLYASGDNIKKVDATYGTDRHDVTAQLAYAYTVEKDGDYFLFKDQDGNYLRCEGEKKLKSSAIKDDKCKWELGAFDEDDATVMLKSAAYSYYIINNHSADMFSTYGGTGDGTNLSKTVLYSDKAPDWKGRDPEPKMEIGGSGVARVDEEWVMDYGKQTKWDSDDGDGNWWGDGREVEITYGDLADNISVTITGANATNFYLPISGDEIPSAGKKTGSAKMTVYFRAPSKGTYTAKMTFHTGTAGVDDIEVILKAEAIDEDSDPEKQPQFSASVDHVYLNPNYSDNGYNDIQSFTFTAKNLQKNLYCKWEHTSSVLFDYPSQNSYMEIVVGSYNLALNGSVVPPFAPGTDYTDVEVVLQLSGLSYVNNDLYQTKLHFYSPKKEDTSQNEIDVIIPIYIKITDDPAPDPATGMEEVPSGQVQSTKVIENGQLYILYNGMMYNVMGEAVSR